MSENTQPNRVQGMVRSTYQWRNMDPKKVIAGSPAQIEYALIDAKHDIEALWISVNSVHAAGFAEGMKRAAEIADESAEYHLALAQDLKDSEDMRGSQFAINDARIAAALSSAIRREA